MASNTVIKLNNIPHGFYEDQMRKYFSQFGKVKNVVLIRSKKTHKSRGFGFVEFELPQVAKAASEAMHNYLFFHSVLKCRQMNRDDLPKNLFSKKYTGPNSVEAQKKVHNKSSRNLKHVQKYRDNIEKVQKILKEAGINLSCHIINDIKEKKTVEKKVKRKMIKVN